jgi:hypothetical protein
MLGIFGGCIQQLHTLEVRWGSFLIKRLSGVSPDVMQAAVSADGRTVCVLIRRLNS